MGASGHPWNIQLGGSQNQRESSGEKKVLRFFQESNRDFPDHNLVSLLSYPCSCRDVGMIPDIRKMALFCEHCDEPPEQINPYPKAFPYGNGMILHFYQQQESSTTKTVHKVINKGLKAYV